MGQFGFETWPADQNTGSDYTPATSFSCDAHLLCTYRDGETQRLGNKDKAGENVCEAGEERSVLVTTMSH